MIFMSGYWQMTVPMPKRPSLRVSLPILSKKYRWILSLLLYSILIIISINSQTFKIFILVWMYILLVRIIVRRKFKLLLLLQWPPWRNINLILSKVIFILLISLKRWWRKVWNIRRSCYEVGVKKGELFVGTYRSNRNYWKEGSVTYYVCDLKQDWGGRPNQAKRTRCSSKDWSISIGIGKIQFIILSSAVDGDRVCIYVYPKDQWQAPSEMIEGNEAETETVVCLWSWKWIRRKKKLRNHRKTHWSLVVLWALSSVIGPVIVVVLKSKKVILIFLVLLYFLF